jgi:Glycosyl transferases group 1
MGILTTGARGCRQVVEPGVTELLVPPRDPGALADAIAELVADRERRQHIGPAGRDKARTKVRPATVHQPGSDDRPPAAHAGENAMAEMGSRWAMTWF